MRELRALLREHDIGARGRSRPRSPSTASARADVPHRGARRVAPAPSELSSRLGCASSYGSQPARGRPRVRRRGLCGPVRCCTRFPSHEQPVTLRMAKDQDVPMNPGRITGLCGRLRCCLAFEHPVYRSFRDRAPAVGRTVNAARHGHRAHLQGARGLAGRALDGSSRRSTCASTTPGDHSLGRDSMSGSAAPAGRDSGRVIVPKSRTAEVAGQRRMPVRNSIMVAVRAPLLAAVISPGG